MEKSIEILIDNYIKYMGKAQNYSYSQYKLKNKYRLMGFNILKDLDNLINKLFIIKEILKSTKNFESLAGITGFLRKYEPKLVKKIFLKLLEKDSLYGLLLDNWEKDEIENQKLRTEENRLKIEKYNQRKEKNKEEYEKIIKELNEIIDNYELNDVKY